MNLDKTKTGALLMSLANPKTTDDVKFKCLMELRNRIDSYKDRIERLPTHGGILSRIKKSSTCKFCGSRKSLTVDHIKPKSKGGPDTIDNIQTLCSMCNINKGDKYPYTIKDWKKENDE